VEAVPATYPVPAAQFCDQAVQAIVPPVEKVVPVQGVQFASAVPEPAV
jgi:hypothetical protein